MADEKKTDRFWRLIGGGKSTAATGSAAPGAGEGSGKSDAAPHAPAVAPQSGDARNTQPIAVPGRKRPNILLLLTDDQGYGDLSCLGSGYICTPHIDRLAAAGSLCTSFYAASPACSPARASLLSGVSPSVSGVRSMLPPSRDAMGIPADLMLLPQRLGEAGYRTGYWGKWHLGGDAQSRPETHGFSEAFYFLSEEIDPFSHIHYSAAESGIPAQHDLWENGQEIHEDGAFLTERMTERALAFIRENREMPFFGVMAYPQPHFPLTLPQKYLGRFSRLPHAERLYAAGLSAVDDSVGLILDELIRLGEAQNTLILFTSDHGPSRDARQRLDGTNQPFDVSQNRLRGGKFSLFEGGLRVPGIFSWPAMLPTGQWMPDVVSALDFVPTALTAAGITIPEGLQGVNLIPRLCGDAPLPTRDLYWEMMGQTALRSGRWKLVLNGQLDEKTPSDSPLHLSDMESDPGETQNLFTTYSGMANEMTDRAMKWRMEVEDYWEKRHAERYAGRTANTAPIANG